MQYLMLHRTSKCLIGFKQQALRWIMRWTTNLRLQTKMVWVCVERRPVYCCCDWSTCVIMCVCACVQVREKGDRWDGERGNAHVHVEYHLTFQSIKKVIDSHIKTWLVLTVNTEHVNLNCPIKLIKKNTILNYAVEFPFPPDRFI